jgi:hypothetical protein
VLKSLFSNGGDVTMEEYQEFKSSHIKALNELYIRKHSGTPFPTYTVLTFHPTENSAVKNAKKRCEEFGNIVVTQNGYWTPFGINSELTPKNSDGTVDIDKYNASLSNIVQYAYNKYDDDTKKFNDRKDALKAQSVTINETRIALNKEASENGIDLTLPPDTEVSNIVTVKVDNE